jgi:ADP-ribose pyrophosphatase
MQILHLDKLTNEQWINLFAATYEHKGHTGRWVFASRKQKPYGEHANDAVIIVPILRNPGEPARLVMIKEFRIPVGGYTWGLPAGLLDPGEGVETTVRREVKEETGLEVVAIRRLTQPLFSSSGLTDEAAAIAFVEVRGVVKPALEASEDIEVVLMEYPDVCRLCDDRLARIDAKAWTVLYLYQQMGKLE